MWNKSKWNTVSLFQRNVFKNVIKFQFLQFT